MDCFYSLPSRIKFGDSRGIEEAEQIWSERGVQQGDPIGPALFALAIHDTVLKAKTETDEKYPGELDYVCFLSG